MALISSKNKRTLSTYCVSVIDKIVTNRTLKSLREYEEIKYNEAHAVEVTAHFVTMNHVSGALTFWLFNDNTGNVDRVKIFPKGTWNHFTKIQDL